MGLAFGKGKIELYMPGTATDYFCQVPFKLPLE